MSCRFDRTIPRGAVAVAFLLAVTTFLPAAGPDPEALKASRQRGVEFLKLAQADDGSWTGPDRLGISALCVTALLRSGLAVDDPVVAKGLKHIESFIQEDGGLYPPESFHRNYESSIALMALVAANHDGRYDQEIEKAVKFLRGLQWDEGENTSESDPAYGGQGYGRHQRPDLSNTSFFVEALREAGVADDDPAIQKALVFISRCQNRESPHNTTAFANKVNDGGFYYTIAAGGASQAGPTANGGLRSYASMTYAGLKSMIYAGLDPTDGRVQAAQDWIKRHYTVKENPGMDQQGLFYYYNTLSKTLTVLKVDEFVDSDGNKHDWRKELADQIVSVQQSNGSWVNTAPRWMEGDPNLVTAYALLALRYCESK